MNFEDVMKLTAAGLGENKSRVLSRLIKEWHPDVNKDPRAARAMSHLLSLRTANAKHAFAAEKLLMRRSDGSEFSYTYRATSSSGLGKTYVGAYSVLRVFPDGFGDLADCFGRFVSGLSFASDDMRSAVSRALPSATRVVHLENGGGAVAQLCVGGVLMSDLVAKRGALDPRQHAWVLTRLREFACYAEWSGFAHGAIVPENLILFPERHDVVVAFGWESAARFGEKHAVLPDRSLRAFSGAPPVAHPGEDTSSISDCARFAFGDDVGASLSSAHPDIAHEIRAPSAPGVTARDRLASWERALDAAYEKRVWREAGFSVSDVYA